MQTDKESLIRKYNVPGPRYTSYPPVPYWNVHAFSRSSWIQAIEKVSAEDSEGISIYIHLPYCESLCTFCGCNTRITVNHAVEDSYIDAVLKEWSLYTEVMKACMKQVAHCLNRPDTERSEWITLLCRQTIYIPLLKIKSCTVILWATQQVIQTC